MLAARSHSLEEYFNWAFERGVKMNKARYPCLFTPGYLGIVAVEDIGPFETLISVPNDLLITSKVAEDSELADLFRKYDQVFDKNDYQYQDLVLVTFLIWEKFKGEQSKWAFFIKNQPERFDVLQDWSCEELEMLQDSDVVFDTEQQVKAGKKKYQAWKDVMIESGVFDEGMTEYGLFVWVNRLLATRSFGKFCPYSTFAPIAEFINHHNTSTYYYYGTTDASSEIKKRYTNFLPGQDHDDELIVKVPVSEISYQIIISHLHQSNISSNPDLTKLIKEAESSDQKLIQSKDLDYGKPDPELLIESSEKYLSIISGDEYYKSGSQLYMNYGRYSNRMLLSYYGFALEDNIYDYARITVSLDLICSNENLEAVKRLYYGNVYMFKVKLNSVCEDLIKITRVLNWNHLKALDACFGPADLELEIQVVEVVRRVLHGKLVEFQTSYEEDLMILKQNLPLRGYYAVSFM